MSLVIPAGLATSIADAAIAAIDAGGAAAVIRIYEGILPNDLDPGTDTLLLGLTLAYPSAPGATDGVTDFDVTTPPEGTVLADGTPGYFIIFTSVDVAAQGGQVGLYSDPDADMPATSLTWLAGETVDLTAGTLTMPTD